MEAVRQNPNCFQEKIEEGSQDDLLYINYDLKPKEKNEAGEEEQNYQLIFVFKDGAETMRIEGFDGLPRTDSWVFFAFSADYATGEVSMYAKSFDGVTPPQSKTVSVVFGDFSLNRNAMLILADVQNN